VDSNGRRVVVVIPTYNEAGNIGGLVSTLMAVAPDLNVLVVDDASPDGTAEVVRSAAAEYPGRVELLSRSGKSGLGTAYRAGFAHALERGHSIIVQMDADLSHDPVYLPALVSAVEVGADAALGSRYVPGGRIDNWPRLRRFLSRWGNRYTSLMLRLPVADSTTGFRAFRAEALRRMDILGTVSEGYSFTSEGIFRAVHRGAGRIVEIPIVFEDRKWGTSKMNSRIIAESMLRVTRWGLALRLRRIPT